MSKHDMTSIGTYRYIKMVTFTITIKRFFTPKNKTKKNQKSTTKKQRVCIIICLVL